MSGSVLRVTHVATHGAVDSPARAGAVIAGGNSRQVRGRYLLACTAGSRDPFADWVAPVGCT